MPYIPQNERTPYQNALKEIVDNLCNLEDENQVSGHLNYIIYSIISRFISEKGIRYFRAQNLIGGTLTCCQQELYRRLIAP